MAHWDMQEIKQRSQESVWAKKELLTRKKKHSKGKSRARSLRGNPDTLQVCEGGIGKAKAHLELNLVEDVEGSTKTCCGSV